MTIIKLKPREEITQLDRLLNGLAQKRQVKQWRGLVIAYAALALATFMGFWALNNKIELAMTSRSNIPPSTHITPANLHLEELPEIEVVLL